MCQQYLHEYGGALYLALTPCNIVFKKHLREAITISSEMALFKCNSI